MGVDDSVGLLGGEQVDRGLVLGFRLRIVRHDEVRPSIGLVDTAWGNARPGFVVQRDTSDR